MKIAFCPSNQIDNATAVSQSESELQLRIATYAVGALKSSGVDVALFHEPETNISSGYPRYPALYRMCRDAAQWGADVVILNHSDSCGSSVRAGLMSLADSAVTGRKGYMDWARAFHDNLAGRLNGSKMFTTDNDLLEFRYSFYSYLEQNGFVGYALIIELANHDNYNDAKWLRDDAEAIGQNIAQALMETLGIEGEDLNDVQAKQLDELRNMVAPKQSFVNAITNALLVENWPEAKRLNDEFYKRWPYPDSSSGLPVGWHRPQ